MNQKKIKIVSAVLFVLFSACVTVITCRLADNIHARSEYEHALEIAYSQTDVTPAPESGAAPSPSPETTIVPDQTDEPQTDEPGQKVPADTDLTAAELARMDIAALKEINPDVIGWICIPDTQINYPLLQGEDNEFYLYQTWEKSYSSAGSIFMESTNDPGLDGFSTIIYGHRRNDGSMFGGLRQYEEQEYYISHPNIYIATETGVYRYAVYAAYQAPVRSMTYCIDFSNEVYKDMFIEQGTGSSVIDTGIVPTAADRCLTLSTCMGNGTYTSRWVVQAVLDTIL